MRVSWTDSPIYVPHMASFSMSPQFSLVFPVSPVYQVKAITGSICSSYFSALAWLREVFSRRWGFGGHRWSLNSCSSAGTRYTGGGGGQDHGVVSPGPPRPMLALSLSHQCSTLSSSHCHNATATPTTTKWHCTCDCITHSSHNSYKVMPTDLNRLIFWGKVEKGYAVSLKPGLSHCKLCIWPLTGEMHDHLSLINVMFHLITLSSKSDVSIQINVISFDYNCRCLSSSKGMCHKLFWRFCSKSTCLLFITQLQFVEQTRESLVICTEY